MRLVIEATAACREVRTGIARYTVRITEALLAAAPQHGDAIRLGLRLSRWKQRTLCHAPAGVPRVWYAPPLWPPWPARLGTDVVFGTDGRVPAWRGVARVATVHDVAVQAHPQFASARFRQRTRAVLERLTRVAHRIVVDSETTRRDFLAHFDFPPERMAVVPLGVEAAYRPLPEAERAPVLERHGLRGPYLLYVGELSARKNVAGLLEGFARSEAAGALPLVLAGALSYGVEPVRERLDALERTGHVRRLGYVDDAELPALYGGAAAFVFPTHYEGFGLPVLEAMACGTPVVGGCRGSVPEIAAEHAVLVEPDDPADIARGIGQALSMDAARRDAARAHAAAFTWERCAARTRAELLAALELR